MTLEIKPLDEKPWDKDLRRFLNMVPNHGYVELVVLKAHLMIEELMWKLLELPLKKPNAINKKEFDFSHCLSLVEAIYWHEKTDWLWKAIRQINGIRNSLAHNVDTVNDEKLTHRFDALDKLIAENSGVPMPNKDPSVQRLHWRLASLYSVLSRFYNNQLNKNVNQST